MNAPVNIDGGDGFDTVIVIGTEFNDDFVITPTGVFGAGLNVNFVNIEKLVVDGGAGDDRFFVLGTGPNFTTEIDGGLGSDAVFVGGPTPVNGVISNTLLGHSGIITNSVESTDPLSSYNGIPVVGISANVADNDTPGIVVIQTNGGSLVIQQTTPGPFGVGSLADGTEDSFAVVLTRPPDTGATVKVTITPPMGLVLLTDGSGNPLVNGTPYEQIQSETQAITLTNFTSGAVHADVRRSHHEHARLERVGSRRPERTGRSVEHRRRQRHRHAHRHLVRDHVRRRARPHGRRADHGDARRCELARLDRRPDHRAAAASRRRPASRSRSTPRRGTSGTSRRTSTSSVDDHAQTIGSNLDFQNAVDATAPGSTITGNVLHAVSVDMNPATTGDEYAILTASDARVRERPAVVDAARGPARRAPQDHRQRPGGRGPGRAHPRQLPDATSTSAARRAASSR